MFSTFITQRTLFYFLIIIIIIIVWLLSELLQWCLDEWHSVEQELTRERGLWGPDLGSSLDKWRLDTTETPSRIRRKLVPNQNFYVLYPYRPYLDLPESVRYSIFVGFIHYACLLFALFFDKVRRIGALFATNSCSTCKIA